MLATSKDHHYRFLTQVFLNTNGKALSYTILVIGIYNNKFSLLKILFIFKQKIQLKINELFLENIFWAFWWI